MSFDLDLMAQAGDQQDLKTGLGGHRGDTLEIACSQQVPCVEVGGEVESRAIQGLSSSRFWVAEAPQPTIEGDTTIELPVVVT